METYYILSKDNSKVETTPKYVKLEKICINDKKLKDILESFLDNSFIFISFNTGNEDIKWFNNTNFNSELEENKIIISKNLKLFRLNNIGRSFYNIFDLTYILHNKWYVNIYNRDDNNKNSKIEKKLSKINTLIIVGNGPRLSNGEDVDSKDFVVRMNSAIIKDCEHLVGTKTDFYWRGSSVGIPDFENLFKNDKLIKTVNKEVFMKTPWQWSVSGYRQDLRKNWYDFFRKLNFYYTENNEETQLLLKELKIGTTGNAIILYFLSFSIKLGFEVYTTGFELMKKHIERAYTEKTSYICDSNHYYDSKYEKDTEYSTLQDLVKQVESHNYPDNEELYLLLHENKFILDVTR